MKLVFRTGDYTDFLVRSSLLAAAGMHTHSDNGQSYSVMPELGLTDGYRIWVLDEDYDDAYSLLKANIPAKDQSEGDQRLEADVAKFSKPLKWMAIAAAVVILLGTYQAVIARDHENLKYLGPAHDVCDAVPFGSFC